MMTVAIFFFQNQTYKVRSSMFCLSDSPCEDIFTFIHVNYKERLSSSLLFARKFCCNYFTLGLTWPVRLGSAPFFILMCRISPPFPTDCVGHCIVFTTVVRYQWKVNNSSKFPLPTAWANHFWVKSEKETSSGSGMMLSLVVLLLLSAYF